jgi:hypothetical protein
MDRYEEDVDARVGGGPSRSGQDGAPHLFSERVMQWVRRGCTSTDPAGSRSRRHRSHPCPCWTRHTSGRSTHQPRGAVRAGIRLYRDRECLRAHQNGLPDIAADRDGRAVCNTDSATMPGTAPQGYAALAAMPLLPGRTRRGDPASRPANRTRRGPRPGLRRSGPGHGVRAPLGCDVALRRRSGSPPL